uniref:Uncharacterized protein TCIL3000_11_15380 n=1 Tax=Trypanosoma congolense (strain IL3000) TaxID=1068625 RepID=G0V2Z8_TRYCI|nr:unnamed protein product [Trypanosoma congolense IL3000]
MSYIVGLLLAVLSVLTIRVGADDGAVSIQLPAGKEYCFFEDVKSPDVKLFLHYMVTSGGSLDVEVTIKGPDASDIWSSGREKEGRVLFKSRAPGRYNFCFSNKMSTVTAKMVTLYINVGEEGIEDVSGAVSKKGMDSIERSISNIQHGLREVKELHNYIRVRERVHRATTEVANTRVLVWTLVEIVVIMLMSLGNVWYLRRIFSKRRIV